MPSISLFSPSRCVLLIGDEALHIFETSASKTKLIETVSWTTKNFEDNVVDIIKRECRGKSLLVLNDMTDQHFKGGQRLPKVGPMDRANVLARKLNVAFPNYPIRGALPIKDKVTKSISSALNANASGGLFLFAAVPMSEPVSKTLTAVKQSLAAIAGFTLLPLESSDMVKALAEKSMKREKTKSRWAIMMGQHMGGGLRQVITRDGQLAMTRMTPVTDLDTNPDAWVTEVAQEFRATISYLSRFGYSPDDGTEVFIIATAAAGQEVQAQIDTPCNFTYYTVNEAADVLGLKIGLQDDLYHADPLHAAWAGRKTRFILPMDAMDFKKIYGPRQAAMVAAIALFCATGFLAWQLLSHTQGWMAARENLANQKRAQTTIEAQYQVETAKMKALGFDIQLIQSSLASFKALEADGIHPLPLFQIIGKVLGPELRLDKMVVTRNGPQVIGQPPPEAGAAPPSGDAALKSSLQAILTLSFPPTLEPEYGVKQVNDLSHRLAEALPPGYDVGVSKQVADLSYTENTAGEVGSPKDKDAKKEDYKAEIRIKGPLQ